MFERPKSGERAILVHIRIQDTSVETYLLDELVDLTGSANAEVVFILEGWRKTPNPKTFIGQGKVEELKQCILEYEAEVVLFNHNLTPSQERNLEHALGCRVLDRTAVILDIFAQRARTYEGKLQVELAQLQHLSTRLVRGWTHLERQKGGIGLRGPGETQLETDRRLIRQRIKSINARLEKVRRSRRLSREVRTRSRLPVIALVGYTNVGKSTLFNQLSNSKVMVADQLFATLDPTLRRIELPHVGPCIIADTVGFIRDLPHQLVEAFRATLEETQDATLLLHVVDASDEDRQDKIEQVNLVLAQIGANDIPQIMVYNKIDQCPELDPHIEAMGHQMTDKVWLSAKLGTGLSELALAISHFLQNQMVRTTLHLSPNHYRLRAALYEISAVQKEEQLPSGDCILTIYCRTPLLDEACQKIGIDWRTQVERS